MTRMLPQEMIDRLRQYVDVSLDAIGIDCVLHIPTDASWDSAVALDVFKTPSDFTHEVYDAKVFIEWGPTVHRLKKLGLYIPDQQPILVWFGNTFISHHEREDYEITLLEEFTNKTTNAFIDIDSAVFSNPEGTWGIKENGGNIVAPADTALTKTGPGQYEYKFNEPTGSDGKTYTYWIKWEYLGRTFHDEKEVTGVVDTIATAQDLCIKSYFELPIQYIPDKSIKTQEFELVNVAVKGMQDAVIKKIYSAVPRRVET